MLTGAPLTRHAAWEGVFVSELGLTADLPAEALTPALGRFVQRGGNLVEALDPAALRGAWLALPHPPATDLIVGLRGGNDGLGAILRLGSGPEGSGATLIEALSASCGNFAEMMSSACCSCRGLA